MTSRLRRRPRGGVDALDDVMTATAEPDAGEQPAQPRPLQSQWTGGPALAVKAATGALWAALLAGPAALALAGVAVLGSAPAAVQLPPATVDRAGEQAAAVELAGRVVRLWLTGVRGQESELTTLVPGAQISLPEVAWQAGPTTVADVRRQSDGIWLVVTAVTVTAAEVPGGTPPAAAAPGPPATPPPPVRFFAVPVRVDPAGSLALTLPAAVPGPTLAPVAVRLGYRYRVPSTDPLAVSVGEFLGALLAGAGDVTRYVSPGTALQPVSPPPYNAVTLTDVATDTELAAGAAVPVDGTRLRALVKATATAGPKQQAQLQYPVTVTVRGGRWEVTAIDPSPALADSPTTAASGSAGLTTPMAGSPSPRTSSTTPGTTAPPTTPARLTN